VFVLFCETKVYASVSLRISLSELFRSNLCLKFSSTRVLGNQPFTLLSTSLKLHFGFYKHWCILDCSCRCGRHFGVLRSGGFLDLFFTSVLGGVSGQLDASSDRCVFRGKSSRYALNLVLDESQSRSECFGEEINLSPFRGSLRDFSVF
jgi:hypothetical protein